MILNIDGVLECRRQTSKSTLLMSHSRERRLQDELKCCRAATNCPMGSWAGPSGWSSSKSVSRAGNKPVTLSPTRFCRAGEIHCADSLDT